MQYLTLGEAEDEVGVTKSTISRAIKAGRLSANRNEHGHYQIDPSELFRVYPPKPGHEAQSSERNTEQHPTQQYATPENNPNQSAATVQWMMKRLDDAESRLANTELALEEKERAYEELKEAYRALPSPESFEAKLASEIERLENEKQVALVEKQKLHNTAIEQERNLAARHIAEAKQKTEKWKDEMAQRQEEIKQAREEARRVSEKAAEDIATIERRAAKERAIRETLESRGFIDRLLNRKPTAMG